jgi:hypothetical protein
MKDFKAFYHGPIRPLLEDFSPTLPHYTSIIKYFLKIWIEFKKTLCFKVSHGDFIAGSTPMKLCLHVHIKRIKAM